MEEVIKVQPKKTYNKCKLRGSKAVGYSISIASMGITAVAIFFPSSATLMILGVNPELTITISVINIGTKLALGLYLSIQTNRIFSLWYAEDNRPVLTGYDVVKNTGIIAGSIPLAVYFSLLTKLSIDTFHANVANQTAMNNTAQLPNFFFRLRMLLKFLQCKEPLWQEQAYLI